MTTRFPDRFYGLDPANPPARGCELMAATYAFHDENSGSAAERIAFDWLYGSEVRHAWPGDTVTVKVPGLGEVTYEGTTFALANGQRVFASTDGQVLGSGTFVSSSASSARHGNVPADMGPACFTPGTLIETAHGEVPIEELEIGDRVRTLENGLRPVRWIGRRDVNGSDRHAPVRFAAGTIGNRRDLLVSPQQRVLLDDWRAEFLFGTEEVLVPARHLVDGRRIVRSPRNRVEYLHLLFDGHEIVMAEGAPTESFHPGDWALENDHMMRAEIDAIFPDAVGCRLRTLPAYARSARAVEASPD